MIKIKKLLLIIIFISSFFEIKAQDNNSNWFGTLDFGVQMSGIKDEDFVSSNYSPLIRLTGGKWLNKKIGIQFGYQGWYFNAIADNDKHFYSFYFTEVVFDSKSIFSIGKVNNRFHDLLFHIGFGYFQNRYYENSKIHGIIGGSNNFLVSKKIKLKFDIGAIIGWDIYQGNDDILPSLSLGIVYQFVN